MGHTGKRRLDIDVVTATCVDCGHPMSALIEQRVLGAAVAHDAWKHRGAGVRQIALRATMRTKTVRIAVVS